MSFKIKYQTKAALFHVKIERDVSAKEAHELAQLALNITSVAETSEEKMIGPALPPGYKPPGPVSQDNLSSHLGGHFSVRELSPTSFNAQAKLGQKPVDKIDMTGYDEPKEGVRIKMLAMPEHKSYAVFAFRNLTGMRLGSSKDIVYGNHMCPILKPEIADKIMEEFRKLNVYAKVVPADNRQIAA